MVSWPNPSQVFALHLFGQDIPLILIAIMTFVLITSSGTMALAVNYGYRRDRQETVLLLCATAALGATFVGMQAFEWTKLIMEGVRPWENPWGAPQFGSAFFMITGFHGCHVTAGVIYLLITAKRGRVRLLRPERHLRDRRGRGTVLALRRPRLGVHLRVLLPVVRRHVASLKANSNTRSRSTCGSGCSCSCSAPAPTWWITSTCRACCAGR